MTLTVQWIFAILSILAFFGVLIYAAFNVARVPPKKRKQYKVFKSAHGEHYFVQRNIGRDDWWTVSKEHPTKEAAFQWIDEELEGAKEVTR